jgi:hypothetical protein
MGTYYLVAPNNPKAEGSYGVDFISGVSNERPVGTVVCRVTQQVAPCPP